MQSGVSLYKRSRGIFDTHRRECDVKVEQREICRCWPRALGSCGHKPRIARNYRKFEEIKKNRFSLKSLWRDQSPAHILISLFFSVLFTYLYLATACRLLLPWPGIKPMPSAMETWSLNYWTAREVPTPWFWPGDSHVGPLASRIVREYFLFILRHPTNSNLVQQPNISVLFMCYVFMLYVCIKGLKINLTAFPFLSLTRVMLTILWGDLSQSISPYHLHLIRQMDFNPSWPFSCWIFQNNDALIYSSVWHV